MDSHNVYIIWSDWWPLPEKCVFSNLKLLFFSIDKYDDIITIIRRRRTSSTCKFNISQPDMATLGSQMHWCLSFAVLSAGCVKGVVEKQPDGVKMASLCGDVERSVVLWVDRGTQLSTTAVLHKFLQLLHNYQEYTCVYILCVSWTLASL